jgi:tryptophanyl-tRNA synthetase
MALGLDLNKAVLYKQSDIPEIFELAWILGCFTPKGDLNRAHAYKAKVQENIENKNKDHDHGVNAGLFNYPVLMAADILLFDTDIVPVGKDQVQHVEMARSMAQRINGVYGEALVLPKEVLSESGQYVPGLDGRKMSKSYGNSIPLFLTEKKLRKTINKIVTDSKAPEEPKEIEGNLIFDLYKCVANEKQINAFAARYREGISWGEAKQALFEIVNDYLAAPRARYFELMEDRSEIDKVLKSGKEQARQKAAQTMQRLRKLITLF